MPVEFRTSKKKSWATMFVRGVKDRLRGTWIHHAVWSRKNPPVPNDRNAEYDRQTVEVMFRVLHHNSNCIDLGAHRGAILQHMISIAPKGRHYAFEPLPLFAQELREQFPRVILHQAAVGGRSGESEFLFVENDPAYSGLRRRVYARPDPRISVIRVKVVTLDEIIPEDEKIDFIKIDVEGGEFHAIKGGIGTIQRGGPVIVFEANKASTGQYGVKADEFYRMMADTLGYELSTMQRWLNREAPYSVKDFERNWDQGPEYYFIAVPR